MAPPNPPTSTHPTAAAEAHKRRKHRRHVQHHQQLPEEPPSPATLGGDEGLATPPSESHASLPPPTSSSDPAARGGVSVAGLAADGAMIAAGQQMNSSSSGRPPFSARTAEPGKVLSRAGTVVSGGLATNGRRGSVEGAMGFSGLLPDPPSLVSPSNGSPQNLAGIQSGGASQVFDAMSVRDLSASSACNVITEEGEVWEKGPTAVVRDGSSIHATFSSSLSGSPLAGRAAGGAEQVLPVKCNAVNTQRTGAKGGHRDDLDARAEGHDRGGHAPGRADGAVDSSSSNLRAGQSGFCCLGFGGRSGKMSGLLLLLFLFGEL